MHQHDQHRVVAIFAAALFTSASLLFFIQPMFAKEILPLLGGSPAVWNTCVVFYEVLLLGGYTYAFVLQRWVSPRLQIWVHLALVLSALAFIPLRIHAFAPAPTETSPIAWLLTALVLSIGLPLLAVAATSPLLQSWFSMTTHREASDPYFLYAASNAGSLVGLLSYPFLIEPRIGLHAQTSLWTLGYVILIALLGMSSIVLYLSLSSGEGSRSSSQPVGIAVAAPHPSVPQVANVSWPVKLRWVTLAFVPASLMLSVTTYISTDIAPMPLLWVIPLALYLLTFIIAFARRTIVPKRTLLLIAPFVMLPLVVAMAAQAAWPRLLLLALHLAVFFVIALVCHRTLASDRPSTEHLTEFYLSLAIGGAIGGIFTAIVAPLVFKTVVEYPLVLVVGAFFLRSGATNGPSNKKDRILDVALPVLLGAAVVLSVAVSARLGPQELPLLATLVFAIAGSIAVAAFRRPWRFALAIGALMMCSTFYARTQENRLYVERNFFGIPTVLAIGSYHVFVHSGTIHGIENTQHPRDPLAYYARTGPLGQLFSSLHAELADAKIAAVGLGVGSATCYQSGQQRWTIYEIDPAIDRIARDPNLFTFVSECVPTSRTIIGDARLSLKRSSDNEYGLMIMDAYSSDYIPVHLITREALELYMQKLTPNGILAFHITNHWFNLEPVLAALADYAHLVCYARDDRNVTQQEAEAGKMESDWVIMARKKKDIEPLITDSRWHRAKNRSFSVWTDDYSSLVTALRSPFDR